MGERGKEGGREEDEGGKRETGGRQLSIHLQQQQESEGHDMV